MREILFRGKKPITENWVYGTGLLFDGINTWVVGNSSHKAIAFGEEHYCVIPETVGQYTGLTDKNGTKIFEGDIVTCQTKYGADVGQVIFAMGKFCVWWHSEYHYPRCAKMIMCYDINSKTKVIGNIHDNPEMLRGED